MSDDEVPNHNSHPVRHQRRRRCPPRSFVIHSTFGSPRQPRSRKNRPCDACRKRKTACVITKDPPCQSCKRRGVPCLSTTEDIPQAFFDSAHEPATLQQPHLASPASHQDEPSNVSAVLATDGQSPVSRGASSHHQGPVVRPPQHISHPPPSNDPAVLVREPLFHRPLNPLTTDRDPSHLHPTITTTTNSAVGAVPHNTLEDIPGRCAYFMGRSSEQDGFLLDYFKYGILRDNFSYSADIAQVQCFSSASRPGQETPVHFLLLRVEHPDHVNREKERISRAIEDKVWPNGDHLVRLFFRHVHPTQPVVSKVRFLTRYADDKTNIPASLRGAVYALASVFWRRDAALQDTPMPFQQHELADWAHEALRREMENPNMFVLQACLLLQHVTPPMMDTLEAPTTWTSAAQATACAQMIGLHVEPGQWNIDVKERHLRRKLWWAVFYADCWSSVCHGNPPHIGDATYTTKALSMEDMRYDEDVPEYLQHLVQPEDRRFQVSTAARFLQLIDMTRSLRIVLDNNYPVNAGVQRPSCDAAQPKNKVLAVEASLRDWRSLIPACLDAPNEREEDSRRLSSPNCPLHLSFYSTRVLVYRALMHPSTREAKFNPDSSLRKWLPDALDAFDSFLTFLSRLNPADLRVFWGRHARSQLVLCGNFLIFLFMLSSEKRTIERAYGLLERFHQTLGNLWVAGDELVMTLLRATKDRIDSFFTQAAEIMRQGPEASASFSL